MVPKLRFKEFCGEWDLKLLKEITEKIGDGLHGTPKYGYHLRHRTDFNGKN